MSDRLKRLIDTFFYCVDIDKFYSQNQKEKLVEWLRENGVIVPPCKTGDTVYVLRSSDSKTFDEYTVKFFYCSSKGINRIYCESENSKKNFRPRDIGKTVFLTKESAERAMKEGEDNAG